MLGGLFIFLCFRKVFFLLCYAFKTYIYIFLNVNFYECPCPIHNMASTRKDGDAKPTVGVFLKMFRSDPAYDAAELKKTI